MNPTQLRQLADLVEALGPEKLRGLLDESAPSPPTPTAPRPERKRQGPPKRPRPIEGEGAAPGLIRTLVARAGSQGRAAELHGFNAKQLSAWLNGTNASPATVERLKEAVEKSAPSERAAG